MKLVFAPVSFLLMLATVASAQQPMFPPTVSPFADQTTWLLTRPFRYQILDTNLVIEMPAGFVTDFASIPRPLWTLASPHEFYSRASIIHDFLYWDQRWTREQADRIMLIAMQESVVGFAERHAIYVGVRAGDNPPGMTTLPPKPRECCGPSRFSSSTRSAPRHVAGLQGSPDEAGHPGTAPHRWAHHQPTALLATKPQRSCGETDRPACGRELESSTGGLRS